MTKIISETEIIFLISLYVRDEDTTENLTRYTYDVFKSVYGLVNNFGLCSLASPISLLNWRHANDAYTLLNEYYDRNFYGHKAIVRNRDADRLRKRYDNLSPF